MSIRDTVKILEKAANLIKGDGEAWTISIENDGYPDERVVVHLPDVIRAYEGTKYTFKRMRLVIQDGSILLTQIAPFTHPHVSGGSFCMGDSGSAFESLARGYSRSKSEQSARNLLVGSLAIINDINPRGWYHPPVMESDHRCVCEGGDFICPSCVRRGGGHFTDAYTHSGVEISLFEGSILLCQSCGSPSSIENISVCPITNKTVCERCSTVIDRVRYSSSVVIDESPLDLAYFCPKCKRVRGDHTCN